MIATYTGAESNPFWWMVFVLAVIGFGLLIRFLIILVMAIRCDRQAARRRHPSHRRFHHP